MKGPTFSIDMDRKCAECGKGGAVPSGLCLSCTTRAINRERMKTETGRRVQARFNSLPEIDRQAMAREEARKGKG